MAFRSRSAEPPLARVSAMASHRRPLAGVAAALLLAAALTACAPEVTPAGQRRVAVATAVAGRPRRPRSRRRSPTATPTAAIPTDCKAILSASVLAQLEGVPLNDPAFGPSGVLPDGSLLCIWGDPAADTTALTTTILRHVARSRPRPAQRPRRQRRLHLLHPRRRHPLRRLVAERAPTRSPTGARCSGATASSSTRRTRTSRRAATRRASSTTSGGVTGRCAAQPHTRAASWVP